ncbi:MAG TPA: hypothetical protein VMT14_19005 [Burkholderiaceae bacterium]|nr:hypothetical protein [Burkholderiaceae bacterium]
MQMDQVKSSLQRIEQCTDRAVAAMRQSNSQAPDDLCQIVDDMHAQAREVRDMVQQSSDQQQLTGTIDRLEQTGDRAKQACQRAGSAVSPQLQSAVIEAHDQISSLKKQMH